MQMPTRWSLFETQCLKKLRAHPKLKEKLLNRPQYTDVVGDRRMLRFLRGHRHDIDKAAEKVRAFLEFRDKEKVDDIRNEILFTPLTSAMQFPHGKQILQATKHDILAPTCTDADGNPVATEYYEFDTNKFFAEISKEDYLHFMLYALEYRNLVLEQMSHNKEKENIHALRERGSTGAKNEDGESTETYGVILRINIIRDFSGLTFGNFLKTQTIMTWVLELASNNYPETLEKSFIVNAPWFFNTIFVVLSTVLERSTVEKMKNLGASFLLDMERDYGIPPEAVPTQLGGHYNRSNVSVELSRPPSADWQGDDSKVYKGPFGIRKTVKRAGGSSTPGSPRSPRSPRKKHPCGTPRSSPQKKGSPRAEVFSENKEGSATDGVDLRAVTLSQREGWADDDEEDKPEESPPVEVPHMVTVGVSRCGCM